MSAPKIILLRGFYHGPAHERFFEVTLIEGSDIEKEKESLRNSWPKIEFTRFEEGELDRLVLPKRRYDGKAS